MDLRRTLVVRLSLSFLGLILAYGVVLLNDLREDAEAEQRAALALTDVLLAMRTATHPTELEPLLQQGELRHVRMVLLPAGSDGLDAWRAQARAGGDPGWFAWLLPRESELVDRQVRIGDRILDIRPDPKSEFREQWHGALQVLVVLIAFSALCVAMTWFAVHRALSPVKDLERALSQLLAGESLAQLPVFALREYSTIAALIERLAAGLQRARSRQQALTHQLMQVQDTERRTLAADLHDEFGQSLTAISALAACIERTQPGTDHAELADCAREIGAETRRIRDHVRQMLATLRPYGIEGSDVGELLQELVRQWQTRLSDWRIDADIPSLPVLPPATSLALYRFVQEALTNCVRHSGARQVQVQVRQEQDHIVVRVADDGCGSAQHLRERAAGGLMGLSERLAMVGGSIHYADVPGAGVVLAARIPVPDRQETI